MERIWKIDVQGRYGYSFAVKCKLDDGYDVIELAEENDLFDDELDADYATAEEITDSPYDIEGLKSATYDLMNE